MQQESHKSALVCIDYINEMVSPGGKLSGKGYLNFVQEKNTLQNVQTLQTLFRNKSLPVIHVKVSFSPDHAEVPFHSPLFGKAKEFNALKLGEWGTEFAELVSPIEQEKIIVKRRVSSFYSTDLELILRLNDIKTVYFCGVATDLAVESAVRDAHDRDFHVVVVEDCCAAANENDHNKSLSTMQKIAVVKKMSEIEL